MGIRVRVRVRMGWKWWRVNDGWLAEGVVPLSDVVGGYGGGLGRCI